MAACAITAGWECPDCNEKFNGIPGVERDKIYVANKVDITALGSTTPGEINSITFALTKGFHKVCFHKDTASGSTSLITDAAAGPHWTQTFTGRVIDDSTATMKQIEEFVDVDLIIVFKKKNGKFQIFGERAGIRMSQDDKNSGAISGDEVGDLIAFSGINNGKARYVFSTDEATTEALLEGLVI